MDASEWLVTLSGLALSIAIALYFFARRDVQTVTAQSSAGIQQQIIVVKGGYQPADIRLKKNVPTRLLFKREETTSCSEEVVIPEFGIKKTLPAFQTTVVEFTPNKQGTFEFMCGMNMLHGSLTIE